MWTRAHAHAHTHRPSFRCVSKAGSSIRIWGGSEARLEVRLPEEEGRAIAHEDAIARAHGRSHYWATHPPVERLSHSASMAYASNLLLLFRRIRKTLWQDSCSGVCVPGKGCRSCFGSGLEDSERNPRVVMVEPWFGNSLTCHYTELAKDNHRRLMSGVASRHSKNFTLLRVAQEHHPVPEAKAFSQGISDAPLYVQRYCAWPEQKCRKAYRCSYGQGHFDTKGLMRLGKLLAAWHLKQGWCKHCD